MHSGVGAAIWDHLHDSGEQMGSLRARRSTGSTTPLPRVRAVIALASSSRQLASFERSDSPRNLIDGRSASTLPRICCRHSQGKGKEKIAAQLPTQFSSENRRILRPLTRVNRTATRRSAPRSRSSLYSCNDTSGTLDRGSNGTILLRCRGPASRDAALIIFSVTQIFSGLLAVMLGG